MNNIIDAMEIVEKLKPVYFVQIGITKDEGHLFEFQMDISLNTKEI